MSKKIQIQQGDVNINQISSIPDGAHPISKKTRGYVLAEGGSTGHAHVIEEDTVEMYEKDGTLYLNVKESSVVKHEEHLPVVLDPGLYEIGIVVEIDPFSEQIKRVVD